jgi:hypothetical protein
MTPFFRTGAVVALFLALAGGCATVIEPHAPSARATPVPLDPSRPLADRVGALTFRGALDLTGMSEAGGLSGLWVAPDGGRFVAIGDTGLVVDGRLDHDADGRLIGADQIRVRRLPVEEGVTKVKRRADAEELLGLPDGGWIVALERDHRLLRYAANPNGPQGVPTPVPVPPLVEEDSPDNGGLESLARLADGRLLTIEEGREDSQRDDPTQPRRAWVTTSPGLPTQRADWLPMAYRSAPRYRPTAAAGLPDGGAVVLERRASLLGGWSTRIVRVPATALHAGADIQGEELARLERPLLNDNFEGIAARPGPNGETLIYIVSDDNFLPFQRAYLVMFSLP